MGRILFFLVALVAVILAVLVLAPGVVPVTAYKTQIEKAASDTLGRDVTFSDNLSFRILPRTAFHVEDLTIANEDGFDGEFLAQVEEADIGFKLLPFISSRSVEIDQFVLTRPNINLMRKANGEVNWDLTSPTSADQNSAVDGDANLRDIRLGDVRIVDGSARFNDNAAGQNYAANTIDLQIILTSLAEPLELKGTMLFQGAPTIVDIVLANLADVMDKKPSNLKLDLKIGDATAGADLTVETADTLRYSGPVQLNAPDLPAFASLIGTEIADAPGFDELAFSGDIDGGAQSFRLSDANIKFDDIDAQGVLTLNWAGARPFANGVLSTDELDLRRYLPPPADASSGFPKWSSAPLDFTGLRNIDADFDISTAAIFLNDLKIGESRLKMTLTNGRMTADIPELSMYGGQGSGRLVVNARGNTPSFSGNFDMGSVQAEPLSLDVFKHDNLLGLGSFKFDFTANGASQAAIMSSLDGTGGFDLSDGLIKGVNLSKIARAAAELRQGFNPASLATIVATARGPAEETDFSEFLSDFTITDGLVNAPTISLNGQFLTMTGTGTVNLPAQTIDLRLSPRATVSADGSALTRSVSIPVRVGGTFSQPTIGLDPDAITRLLTQNVLQQVLGGRRDTTPPPNEGDQVAPEDEEETPEEATPEEAAADLIRGIFDGLRKDGDKPKPDE